MPYLSMYTLPHIYRHKYFSGNTMIFSSLLWHRLLQYCTSLSGMVIGTTKPYKLFFHFNPLLKQRHYIHSVLSSQKLEQVVRAEIEAKNYDKIPDLLNSSESCPSPNPFSFFSSFPQNMREQIIDEMLQSFMPLRPRSKPRMAYSYLLSYTLENSDPLPLALAILQRTLRSGCVPVPQTHVLLTSAWLNKRQQCHSVSDILLEMQSIKYQPDCKTCNYLLSSLCAVDQWVEAVKVLKGMSGAGCFPNQESYAIVIGAMCRVRRTAEALDLLKQMVSKCGLTPGQGTLTKLLAALRANREIWKAVEMIEFLENEGYTVGFDCYEMVIEGCLEKTKYVLAGKVAMRMTERGFIPYINVRLQIIEGLASLGEWQIASALRQRFASLGS